MESIAFTDWGLIDYSMAYDRQIELFNQAIADKLNQYPVANTIIFCEHPPVITIGKSGDMYNLLFSEERLNAQGVAFYKTDRGGDVTFHGPGQVVGYPILDLEGLNLGLKEYISLLEEAIIRLLSRFGVRAERLTGATGVWIDTDKPTSARKICAIGVRTSRYVSMHGFALNVSTDLNYFQLINPCGFTDKGVTSLEKEIGRKVDMQNLKQELLTILKELLEKKS